MIKKDEILSNKIQTLSKREHLDILGLKLVL